MGIKFDCMHCRRSLSLDASAAGRKVKCPSCGNILAVPGSVQVAIQTRANGGIQVNGPTQQNPSIRQTAQPPSRPFREVPLPSERMAPPQTPTLGETIFCTQCGQQNLENNFKCMRCGVVLHGPSQPKYVVTESGWIPYKNPNALWAYYLGIFGLFPLLGAPLAIAALILGIKGLQFANDQPEVRGKAHAWVGIILGGISGVGHALLIISIMLAILFG